MLSASRSQASSYNLPPAYHTYGNKIKRDAEGAGNVIFNWQSYEAEESYDEKLNIIKMNINAIQRGHTSPKAITRYDLRADLCLWRLVFGLLPAGLLAVLAAGFPAAASLLPTPPPRCRRCCFRAAGG